MGSGSARYIEPVLYAWPPMIQVPKLAADASRVMTIERLDRPGERTEVTIPADVAAGAYYDLAKTGVKSLARGGVYRTTLGAKNVTFKIDEKAKIAKAPPKSGKASKSKPAKLPVVSRLLRFPQG